MWFNLGARPLKDWGSPDSRIYSGGSQFGSEAARSSLALLSLSLAVGCNMRYAGREKPYRFL